MIISYNVYDCSRTIDYSCTLLVSYTSLRLNIHVQLGWGWGLLNLGNTNCVNILLLKLSNLHARRVTTIPHGGTGYLKGEGTASADRSSTTNNASGNTSCVFTLCGHPDFMHGSRHGSLLLLLGESGVVEGRGWDLELVGCHGEGGACGGGGSSPWLVEEWGDWGWILGHETGGYDLAVLL